MNSSLSGPTRFQSRPDSWRPILFPELGAGPQRLFVGTWLTEIGEAVVEGDPVVEVMLKGIVFDVAAPVSGTLRRCELTDGDAAQVGDTLGWIDAEVIHEESTSDLERTSGDGRESSS